MTVDRCRALLDALPADVDAVLVTKLVNVRYLTGFTGSNGAVLVTRDADVVLATDGRYEIQAAAEAPDVRLMVTRAVGPDLVASARTFGARRLAIERHHLTLTAYDAIAAVADDMETVGAGTVVETLRARKDQQEITALRRACEVTDAAFEQVLESLLPGVTEREAAWRLLAAMRDAGAEAAAFDPIVAFGPNSAIPHHQPTDRPLARGDLVKLDFGARVAGYHADMTRTVVCGPPAGWQRDLHAEVVDVQARCRAATAPGAVPSELDALAQQLVADGGHRLVHGLGHGVGLEIHEQPFLVPGSADAALLADAAVTVEPGVYLPDRGGVRIEDTVHVVAGGPPVSLTRSTRELLEV
jgi:Xaa-Pro aminopeptidase